MVAPPAARLETMQQYPSPLARLKNELLTQMRKRWLMGVGGGAALLLLGLIGLLAAIVFRVNTASGILVVQVNEPNAEVYVDGEKATVSWDAGGKKAVIRVRPGTCKVEIKKDGFTTYGEEVTLEDNGNRVVAAKLERKKPSPDPTPATARDGKDKRGAEAGDGTSKTLDQRQKRLYRWSINFNTKSGNEYLQNLEAIGAVLAIPTGPNSYEVVDLTKRPFKPEVKDISTIQKVVFTDSGGKDVQGLVDALGLSLHTNRIVVFIPSELEDELSKAELAYGRLDENDVFETHFAIDVPGAGGRKYDIRVTYQKRK